MSRIVTITTSEVHRLVKQIKQKAGELAEAIRKLRDSNGWKVLGYATWAECCEAEFGYSKRHANRLIQSQQVIEQVGHMCPSQPNDRQASELARLPEEQRADCWQDYVEECETAGEKPTAAGLRAMVDVWAGDNEPVDVGGGEVHVLPIASGEAQDWVTLEEWNGLNEDERHELYQWASDRKFNRQDNGSIEWAQWSWNPVTGCEHGCEYCYARDIANRFYPQGFVPAFHPHRLTCPENTKVPKGAEKNIGLRNVFVTSMGDLFGKWVPEEWILAVLSRAEHAPQWNFLFLTKNPARLAEFKFPENAWVGTTVDVQSRVKPAEKAFAKVEATVKFLSVEPLLEDLTFSHLDYFDWVIIGGGSRSSETEESRPPRIWVNHLYAQTLDAGCQVYEKPNLLERITQYPANAWKQRGG